MLNHGIRILAQAADPGTQPIASFIGLLIIAAWVLFIVLGARWIHRDARRRGHPGAAWATAFAVLSIFGFIPGAIVLTIYLFRRSDTIVQAHEAILAPPGTPPGPPTTPAAGVLPPPSVPLAPAPIPPGAPPARVKCPRCQSIFEYQRAVQGRTHLKCPSCGEEGDI